MIRLVESTMIIDITLLRKRMFAWCFQVPHGQSVMSGEGKRVSWLVWAGLPTLPILLVGKRVWRVPG